MRLFQRSNLVSPTSISSCRHSASPQCTNRVSIATADLCCYRFSGRSSRQVYHVQLSVSAINSNNNNFNDDMAQIRGTAGYQLSNQSPFGGPKLSGEDPSPLDTIRAQTSKIEDVLDSLSEPLKPYVKLPCPVPCPRAALLQGKYAPALPLHVSSASTEDC